MDIDEYIAKKKQIKAELAENGKTILKEYLAQWFIEHPEVWAITWTQYTPYFNDGEPCVFSVNTNYGGLEFKSSKEEEWKSGYETEKSQIPKEINVLGKKLHELEDVCQDSFGDHTRVEINRDGDKIRVVVEEYEHD